MEMEKFWINKFEYITQQGREPSTHQHREKRSKAVLLDYVL